MNSLETRIEQLEKTVSVKKEPIFWGNGIQEWTEKQKQMMLRKYPDRTFFWIPLSPNLPYEANRMPENDRAFLEDLASLVQCDDEKESNQIS